MKLPRRRSRLSSGHVVMVVAGLLGLLLSLSVLRRADDTVAVVVATRDAAPGTQLSAAMLGTARVHASDGVLAGLVPAASVASVTGSVVVAGVRAGDPIERSALAPVSTHRAARLVSFPVDASVAVGGALAVGDRIDVLAAPRGGGAAGYVFVDAAVVAVRAASSGPLRTGDTQISITVSADAAGAQRLAGALHGADLLVVRATGAAKVASVDWFDPAVAHG